MIGFIIAMDSELSNNFKVDKDCNIHVSNNQKYYIFNNNNKSFVLTFSGIGKANAASTTMNMIKTFNTKKIINLGVVGSHDISTNIKDCIIVKSFYYLDVDVTAFGYKLGQVPQEKERYDSSLEINEKIIEIFNNNFINFKSTNIGTIDSFICRNNFFKLKNANFDLVSIIDMESTAIAQICDKNNVQFSSIKIVSDNLNKDEPSSNQFNFLLKELSFELTKILFLIIDNY